jgi:RNA polymerase sigma factor (sigma-70 family)
VALNGSTLVDKIARGRAAARTSTFGYVPLAPPLPGTAKTEPDTPESLFRDHYAHLVRSLTVAFGDSEAAADAVQAAFIQLCLHWKRAGELDDPIAWVRRLAVSHLRHRNGHTERRLSALLRTRPQPQDDPAPPFRADLEAALARLALPQRVAIALHYMEDLSVAQLARSMDISERDADAYLQDARKALAPNFKPQPWSETIFY